MSAKPIDPERASPAATPQIFDPRRIAVLHDRAARRRQRLDAPQFILTRIAEDIADRLLMINRRFDTALLIAPSGFDALLTPHIHPDKAPTALTHTSLRTLGKALNAQTKFDLIILVMAHHNENNPQGLLTALKQHMIDDGHIMTVCLGGESLTHLRQSLYTADQAHYGGAAARFHPVMEIKKNVQLLAHCGFNLTMGDRDRVAVQYKKLSTLINDIRDLGESYALTAQKKPRTTRAYWAKVEAIYQENYSENERLNAHFDILWASGWTPHHSQQKPLKPGSAKTRLADMFPATDTLPSKDPS